MTRSTTEVSQRNRRRLRSAVLAVLAAGSLVFGAAVVVPANAAPYVNCNRPVYTSVQATVRCDAASAAKVRLWVRCWAGPIVTGTMYTAWVSIPAGQSRTLLYTAHGWCPWPGQWTVSPQIQGA